MSFRTEVVIWRQWIVDCKRCNENIIERADEESVVTRADAERYAREHWAAEHAEADQ